MAYTLAHYGKKTLLIDTDVQGNCGTCLGLKSKKGLAEGLLEEQFLDQIIQTARPNLDVLTGGRRLALAARTIARESYDIQYYLANRLEKLEKIYDHIFIDTAPIYSEITINVYFYGVLLFRLIW